MKPIQKTIASSFALLMLAACGGGGSGDNSGAGSNTNPLKKYEGTYYVCDGRAKETATVTASGANSMSITFVEDIYQNTNCQGAVIGTYKLAQPLVATYQNQATAKLPPVTIFPTSDVVDRISLSYAGGTAQLTGSGVTGKCVVYPRGETCFEDLTQPAGNWNSALYLKGDYLVTFSLENGVLEYGDVSSKDPLFNINMLIKK
jgi:hypothetical protein